MTYVAAQYLQSLRRRVDFFSEHKPLKAKAGRGREIMKTNLQRSLRLSCIIWPSAMRPSGIVIAPSSSALG